jgi:hypothetical protein
VEKWVPVDEATLTSVLTALRGWSPFDGEAVLDDAATVLDEVAPAPDTVALLAERLRGHLDRLVGIAARPRRRRGRLRRPAGTASPADSQRAGAVTKLGRRRLPAPGRWLAHRLLDRLAALKCIKEYA